MRALAAVLSMLPVLSTLGGCGGESELTCDVLMDPTTCWAEAALAARECLPDGEVAVLEADRRSCSFAGGTRVIFETALPQRLEELERLAFTIEVEGTTCASFVDTFANRMELEAGGQRAVSELHPGGAFHLHCEDGPSYEAPFERLFECSGSPPPTDGFDLGPDFFSFRISAVTTPDELFRCESE